MTKCLRVERGGRERERESASARPAVRPSCWDVRRRGHGADVIRSSREGSGDDLQDGQFEQNACSLRLTDKQRQCDQMSLLFFDT